MIGTQVGKKNGVPIATTDSHIYTLEWDENELRSYVGNQLYFSFANEQNGPTVWPFNQRFYLILNSAIVGGLGGKHGIDNTKFPHTYEIDYVRIYQLKGEKSK